MKPNAVALLAAAMHRHSTRWDKVMRQPIMEEIDIGGGSVIRFMPGGDRQKLNEWFAARYNYLQGEYDKALRDQHPHLDPDKSQWWRYDSASPGPLRQPRVSKEVK